MNNPITVLVYEPGQIPYEKVVPNSLPELQALVGGYIEAVRLALPEGHTVFLVCNEEGKRDLPPNRPIPQLREVIRGTFFICASERFDFLSLSSDEIQVVKQAIA